MNLLAQVWREVGRHLEIDASVRRIAPMLAGYLPVESLLIRRLDKLDKEPVRLTTVASARVDTGEALELTSTRSTCDEHTARELLQFIAAGSARWVGPRASSALARVLVPAGLLSNAIALPLSGEAGPLGVALLVFGRSPGDDAELLNAASALMEPCAVALENDQRLHELARMREALEADRQALLTRLDRQDISETIIGESAGLRSVMVRVEQVAPTDAPVLILGETGSGKEVIARAIHSRSRRARGPVVRVNCGAIAPQLIDSELFGHERGSFTGAVNTRKGWFERADGGTLFLDELGELPLEAQVRLLRVLQDGSLERVGGHQAISVDVRIVAATHRNLEHMVAAGRFREDLWYRISVFPVRLPGLRERAEDIPALASHFAQRAGQRLGGSGLRPSESDVQLLQRYAWPGNVRELAAVIERAAILGSGKRLEVAKALGGFDADQSAPTQTPEFRSTPPLAAAPTPAFVPNVEVPASNEAAVRPLGDAMADHIERALASTHGRIEGPFGAAKLLGINPHTLRARMRKLGIDWARYRPGREPASG
jgi:transcriptional regulator with GAF, ATPase, and Fis domain